MFLLAQILDWVSLNWALCGAVSLVLLVSLFLGEIIQHLKVYLAFKKIPTDPRDQHILFGHAPKMLQDMGSAMDWFRDLSVKMNWKLVKYCYGPTLYQMSVLHPEGAKVILRSDPKSDQLYKPLQPWLGKGLLIANGPRWIRSRRLLTSAFHYDILRPYLKVYEEAATTMTDLWTKVPEGESFNVFPYISLFTLDVMLQCACSYYSNCQLNREQSDYIRAVYELSDLATRRILSVTSYFDWMYMLKPDYWKNRRLCSLVHDFSMNIIKRRRAILEDKKSRREDTLTDSKRKYLDFIDILLEAKDDEGVGLTDLEIRSEVDTFVFEGHDTTAAGIAWTLYNLALYPQHQRKCVEEVDAIFQEKDEINQQGLKSLVYLKYCFKESIRLFPPVAGHGRVLTKETDICGVKMPKGTPVICFTYALHRNPEFWENPEEFDPLRFTPENSKNRHSHAYVPFSAGPRNCIGQEFATNEVLVVLANILRRFELFLDESKTVTKDFLVILRPNALHLKLKHRNI